MKAGSEDRALQDYLDDRLSAEERERFERRIEGDPDLAARVTAGREVGTALRDGEEALSPGFYTRARARFEESAARPERRWFRLFSWESAGLVAAVVLAAALFVPPLVRQDLPGVTLLDSKEAAGTVPAEFREAPKAQSDGPDKDADLADRLDAVGYVAGAAKAEKKAAPVRAPKGDLGRSEAPAEAEEEWAPAPLPAAERKSRANEAPPRAVLENEPAAEARRDRGQAPAAQPEETAKRMKQVATEHRSQVGEDDRSRITEDVPTPAAAAPEASWDEENQAEGLELATGAVSDGYVQRQTATIQLLPGSLLPAGAVAPGEIRIVESAREWDDLRFGPAGQAFADPGTYDPQVRMLLIGARPAPFECRQIQVIPGDDTYRVRLKAPAADGLAALHGCAIALPRDGKRIVMDYSAGFE